MELIQTVGYMTSDSYKKRFIAEVKQNKIRMEKLDIMLSKLSQNRLNFEPKTPPAVLRRQSELMHKLDEIYQQRAVYESINLEAEL